MGVITGDSVDKLVWPAPTGFALNCACVFVCVCRCVCAVTLNVLYFLTPMKSFCFFYHIRNRFPEEHMCEVSLN